MKETSEGPSRKDFLRAAGVTGDIAIMYATALLVGV